MNYDKPSWVNRPIKFFERYTDDDLAHLEAATRAIDERNNARYRNAIDGRESRRALAVKTGNEKLARKIAGETISKPAAYLPRFPKFKALVQAAREQCLRLDRANELARQRRQEKLERARQQRKEKQEREAAARAEHAKKIKIGLENLRAARIALDDQALHDFDALCVLDGVDPALMWAWAMSVDAAFEWRRQQLSEVGHG